MIQMRDWIQSYQLLRKQLLMMSMHDLMLLLRKTAFDDPETRSDTLVAVTQETAFDDPDE